MDQKELDRLLKRNSQQGAADIAIIASNASKLVEKDPDIRNFISCYMKADTKNKALCISVLNALCDHIV